MEQIKLNINGKEVVTSSGKTILEVVEDNNIDKIPTLCHDKRLAHYTSCFLCVVESEGSGKLLPSCSTVAVDGMNLKTRSGKVEESRKAALELLMSNHYADCIGPCKNSCPAGVDAQSYIALISMGRYKEALQLVKENNPLPLSIGRVCVKDCEAACRRTYIDEPVSVNAMKRFIADADKIDMWKPVIKEKKNRRVAVIGGGPAGLSCAYYLTVEGYSVTIFERLPKLGGMLRYGIPEYRLPKRILDQEINWIINLGVTVKTGIEAGVDLSIKKLQNEGYDAVFVGVGAQKASKMGLKGEDNTYGVFRGIDFLREIELSYIPVLKGTVIIVGGGNTAIDAARTALRCGAEKVKIVYRRSLNEMPASKEEINAAEEEGVEILFLTNPVKIISENNKLKAVECLKMKLEEGKKGERPKPVPVPGSEFIIDCDFLIGAIGQNVETSFSKNDPDLSLENWGTAKINGDTMETSVHGVFAGGDVVTGPFTAITSIAQGKKAALSIMNFLEKGKAGNGNGKFYSLKHKLGRINEKEFIHIQKLAREKMEELEVTDRIHNFQEVERGITEDQSFKEACRCLECGCSEYYDCSLRKYSDEYHISIADYSGEIRKYMVDARHPFIVLDPNKCINCGLCVRTCEEILKVSALGFVYRGFKSIVKPAMEKALAETNCISCGNCIDVCPTGAITEKYPFKVLGTLPKEDIETICSFCPVGCRINFKKINDNIFYVANTTDSVKGSTNRGYLCTKGRFGHRYLMQKERVLNPKIRRHGIIDNVTLNEALNYTAKKIKGIIELYGRKSVAVLGSPRLSNEELYLIQKFARTGIKNNQVSSFTDLISSDEYNDDISGFSSSNIMIEDLNKADVIVVLNSNLSEENLVMELKIKEAQKHGAKIVLINSSEIRLTRSADLWIDSKKGTNTLLFNALLKRILTLQLFNKDYIEKNTEGFEQLIEMVNDINIESTVKMSGVDYQKFEAFAEMLEDKNKNVVFIYNIDSNTEKSHYDLKAVGNLLLLTERMGKAKNGIIILREFSNSQGSYESGVTPALLPGIIDFSGKEEIKKIGNIWGINLEEIFRPVDLKMKFKKGEIKGVIIFGEDPLADESNRKYFNSVEFLAVMDTYHTNTTSEADVIIPAENHIEKEGSYTRCDGLIQKGNKIINGPHSRTNLQTISKLAGLFTKGFEFETNYEVSDEIKKVNSIYKSKLSHNRKYSFAAYKIDLTTSAIQNFPVHYQDNYYLCHVKKKLL
jgi:formate dehydrogenase major subunit